MSRLEENLGLKIIIGARKAHVVVFEDMRPPAIIPQASKENRKYYRARPSQFAEYNYKKRLQERREAFYSMVYNNFQPLHSVMVTLTFGEDKPEIAMKADYTDLDICHKQFKKFIQRLNYHYDGFKYVATFARQPQSRKWHYHMICNITDADQSQWNTYWGDGFTWINGIETAQVLRRRAIYCVKNMSESAKDELKWEKGYLCSKGLQRNKVLRSWNEQEAQKCWEAFNCLKDSPKKYLYKASRVSGIKVETQTENGEVETNYFEGAQLNDDNISKGAQLWESQYHHISCHHNSDQYFDLLTSAVRKTKVA